LIGEPGGERLRRAGAFANPAICKLCAA